MTGVKREWVGDDGDSVVIASHVVVVIGINTKHAKSK